MCVYIRGIKEMNEMELNEIDLFLHFSKRFLYIFSCIVTNS